MYGRTATAAGASGPLLAMTGPVEVVTALLVAVGLLVIGAALLRLRPKQQQ